MRGGKYWNVGLYDRSLLGATDHQLYMLKRLYQRDFRGEGLTVGQATDLISKGLERRSQGTVTTSMADKLFSLLMKKATAAASEAASKWLERNPETLFTVKTAEGPVGVNGYIGAAYLTAPKKGSGLATWLKEQGFNDRRNSKVLPLHYEHSERLEAELHLEACVAALEVLKEAASETGDVRVVFVCDEEDYRISA